MKENTIKLTFTMLIFTLAANVFAFKGVNKDAFSGSRNFWYIDKEDRVELLSDLYKQTKAEYTLWDFKKKRIGVDGDKLFNEAIALEEKLEDPTTELEMARANLDFYDRGIKLIAGFKDTHFGLRTHIALPFVISGLSTTLIDGKVYVTTIHKKLIEKSASGTFERKLTKVKLLDEVISVDGKPTAEAMAELIPYIDASSDGFAQGQAGRFLLERYFKYPTKPYFDIEVKNKKRTLKVRVPLYFSDNSTRMRKRDATFYLKSIGAMPIKDLKVKWNKDTRKYEMDQDLGAISIKKDLPKGAIELNNWASAKKGGQSIVRSAIIIKDAKAYAYMQVNSFSVTNLYQGEQETTFVKALQNEVSEFKARGLDLILDIRRNGGGNGGYPAKLLSVLTKKDQVLPNTTWATPVTRYMRQMVDYYGVDEIFKDLMTEDTWEEEVEEFYTAIDEGRKVTRAIYSGDIKADKKVNGYEGKIVALVSPYCISACDITSMLLKGSKRATLIGTHANGTGAGYRSNGQLNTSFVDRYKVFATTIPNVLFGYGPKDKNKELGVDSAYELNSENVVVEADIQYKETLKDYNKSMSGWIEKAIETLNTEVKAETK